MAKSWKNNKAIWSHCIAEIKIFALKSFLPTWFHSWKHLALCFGIRYSVECNFHWIMNSENYVFNEVHFGLEIFKWLCKQCKTRAVVVVQLVEMLLSYPEVSSWNPVIGKKLYWLFTVNCIEKTKIKIKRPGKAHLKKNVTNVCLPFDSDQTLVPWWESDRNVFNFIFASK